MPPRRGRGQVEERSVVEKVPLEAGPDLAAARANTARTRQPTFPMRALRRFDAGGGPEA